MLGNVIRRIQYIRKQMQRRRAIAVQNSAMTRCFRRHDVDVVLHERELLDIIHHRFFKNCKHLQER